MPLEFPPYLFYAALDPILTARLARTEIARQGRESPVYSLEMEVRAVCTRMEQNGLRVNAAFCDEQANGLRARSEMIKRNITDKYGLLVTSPSQLSKWFIGQSDAREWMTKRPTAGMASVDKESASRARRDRR